MPGRWIWSGSRAPIFTRCSTSTTQIFPAFAIGGLKFLAAFLKIRFPEWSPFHAFIIDKSGNVLTKGDVIKWAMSGDIKQDKVRIVYENNEVGIHHAFVTFDDGNV